MYWGKKSDIALTKESHPLQIITISFFFFEGIKAAGQGECGQYSITRSFKRVHQSVVSNSMKDRCHGVRGVLV